MHPTSPLRRAQRSNSSLEPLEARIAPAGVTSSESTAEFVANYVDLVLTKTADVTSAHPGDLITYTLHLTNEGTADATNVTISDPVVPGLNFVATENPGWSLNAAKTAYTFDLSLVKVDGLTREIPLKLRLSPTVGPDVETVENTATVQADEVESNTSNNSGSVSVDVIADAVLHITLRSDTPEIAHGGKVFYSLIYSNTGDRDAHVVLTEHLNSNSATFAADNPGWTFNGSVWEYDAGILAARSGNHSVPYVVQADYYIPTTITSLTNVASIDYAPDSLELGETSSDTTSSVTTPIYQGIYVLSPGTSVPGHYAAPKLQVVDITTGVKTEILAYPTAVRDSIRTSLGDFNGDGFDDILVTTEHGAGAARVFDGKTGLLMASPLNGLQPFGKNKGSFTTVGEFSSFGRDLVASIDLIDSIGSPEVVFGSALGGGAVKVYSTQSVPSLTPGAPVVQQVGTTFFPFGVKYTGGVRVATGDLNGDGRDDLVVAQGNFGGQVIVYNGGNPNDQLMNFQVGGAKYKGGLNIAVGDIDNDGDADIVTGRNRLSAPTVEIFSYQIGSGLAVTMPLLKGKFDAFATNYRNGVRVALADIDHDGTLDIIATTGYAGRSQVKIFDGGLYSNKPTTGNISLIGASLLGDDLTLFPGYPAPFPVPVPFPQPQFVITATPALLKSFTAFPGNLNQAVWASATVIVPAVGSAPIWSV